jgi:hypothetical protein
MLKTRTKIIITIPVCILSFILILSLAMFFSNSNGRGSFTSTKSIEYNTKNKMIMYYFSFAGYKYTPISLKKGDKLVLDVSVTTKEGNLKISLENENNKELFSTENPKKHITKTVNINENGNYKIQVEGKHQGGYNVKWNIES